MNEYETVSAPVAKPARIFSKKEVILAWLSVAVGYFYCRTCFVWMKPLYGFIFTVALFVFGFVFLKGEGSGQKRALFYPISALIINLAMFTAGSTFLTFWVFCYSVIAFFMWCQTRKSSALEKIAGPLYFYEFVCGLLLAPIFSFVRGFQAISSNKGGKKAGQTVLFVLLGLFIAGLPTVVVYLLLSFDENFTGIIENILNCISEEVFIRVLALICGIPFGMLFYSALFASKEESGDLPKKESFEKANRVMKFTPQIVSIMALLPIFLLYIIFIIAQKDYYVDVFTGTLPKAETFSSFARDGFFRLCFVAALNAGAVGLLRIFTRKNGKGKIAFSVRAATVLFSLVSIILAATAISQMMMYVSAYGLTELRVYALWFMGLIAVVFFVALLSQFVRKLPFLATSIAVFTLFFSVLVLPDFNAIIANHNYNCYLENGKIDIEYLADLGDSGVPTLVKLTKDGDQAVAEKAALVLAEYLTEHRENSLASLRLSRLLADSALKDLSEETMCDAIKNTFSGSFETEIEGKKCSVYLYNGNASFYFFGYDYYGDYTVEEDSITLRFKKEAAGPTEEEPVLVELRHSFEIDENYRVLIDGKELE